MNKALAHKEVMKATTCAAQKMAWPLTVSFMGLKVVPMDWVIFTLLTNCQGIHMQNLSCGSLSASLVTAQLTGLQNKPRTNCPLTMKCFYAGCGILINANPAMLNQEVLSLN